MKITRRETLALLGAGAVSGCAPWLRRTPDLGGLYDRAAQVDDRVRNPVVLIPGILGSRLVDGASGKTVWGAFGGDFANPRTEEGARLVALPMQEGKPFDQLRDGVVAAGVLDRVGIRLFGLPIELQAYWHILHTLGVGGYRDEGRGRSGDVDYRDDHFTCFQFPYDWRRDNAENARRLHRFLVEKKAYVERELVRRHGSLEREVRFDVIAHSMGGLLLRYYLQHGPASLDEDEAFPAITWEGTRLVDHAFLIGTPNAGSVQSFRTLVEGARFSRILPTYRAALLGTMPSIYQLMPRARHRAVILESSGAPVDLLDPETWRRHGWGLLDLEEDDVLQKLLPDAKRRADRERIASDHLEKILARARRFHAALDRPAPLPEGLVLHLYAGDSVATGAVVGVDEKKGRVRVLEKSPGDGTVTRTSALLDERVGAPWQPGLRSPIEWSGVTFVFADHLALTREPLFVDNILYRLLEAPRSRTGRRVRVNR